ncbi:disulfide bond formation regulator [Flavobacterium sp. Root935]|uniref:OsmC family protein n=1 Tax=unclassified Flavobacterium TaxID=196869 RepID=UPI00070EDE27|nr:MULTISPECIES: OsmC family protein [unclassified Flavobacterium]KRD60023.1 disulfide bond formation regulator [Flavobacterium sp. Root935]MDQ1164039.1 putative redox protein [Flavobacterium sp. SORGH_AS_0622]
MKVTLNRVNDAFHFKLKNERGHIVDVDSRAEFGGSDLGASPMELVLMGVAGCSAIDMISILKKQRQEITSFNAEVEGTRVQIEEAKPFKEIDVVFYLEGEINPEKAKKAAQLSFEKYCSVAKTVEPTAAIKYKVVLNNEELR